MSNTQHTPGPWKVNCEINPSVNESISPYREICDLRESETSKEEVLANARLIAAAPNLLKELQAMTDAYARAMKDAGVTHYPEALFIVRQARAAIARAKGE